jgi:hypothetical protein
MTTKPPRQEAHDLAQGFMTLNIKFSTMTIAKLDRWLAKQTGPGDLTRGPAVRWIVEQYLNKAK